MIALALVKELMLPCFVIAMLALCYAARSRHTIKPQDHKTR